MKTFDPNDYQYNGLEPVTVVDDYLWTFKLDLDTSKFYDQCLDVNNTIIEMFGSPEEEHQYGSDSAYYHNKYNFLTSFSPNNHRLFGLLQQCSMKIVRNDHYYIRCWLNKYDESKNIEWHRHWDADDKSYHGFYCVNVEGDNLSSAQYRIPNHGEVEIISRNNILVIGKSEDDYHRSTPWLNNGSRITIAFDIVPVTKCHAKKLNDVIPLI